MSVLLLAMPGAVHAETAGSLDGAFAAGGRMTPRDPSRFTNMRPAEKVLVAPGGAPIVLPGAGVVQPDGKVVSISLESGLWVCRTLPGGTLDPSFGGGHCVRHPGWPDVAFESGRDVALQPDGRILVLGQFLYANGLPGVLRFEADGRLDAGFGTNGWAPLIYGLGIPVYGEALLVQPDGRIIVGGTIADGSSFLPVAVALARYLPNGTLDQSFGTAGRVRSTIGTSPTLHALALQADGRIVAVGDPQNGDCEAVAAEGFVARYTATGNLDPTFGTGGLVRNPFAALGTSCGPYAVLVQPDGRIVVGGAVRFRGPSSAPNFAVARLLGNGRPDLAFGAEGVARADVPPYFRYERIRGLARQPDGGLLAVGWGHATIVRWLGGTCGNGVLEAGEDCDDGGAAGGCPATCCTADEDGDGLCDAVDPCTGPAEITGAQLSLGGFGVVRGGAPGDRLVARGEFVVPAGSGAPLDPSVTGMRFLLEDTSGTLLDVTIPGGPFDARLVGWRGRSAGAWVWTDKTQIGPSGANGLTAEGLQKVKLRYDAASGRVRFNVRGAKTGFYQALADRPPLAMTLVPTGATAPDGRCGRVAFAASGCSVTSSGLTCR